VSDFLNFLEAQRVGILVLLLILIATGALVNWVLYMFGWGRYHGPVSTDSKLIYVLANFFVKIIDDFRHLLALLIAIVFAAALFTAMWPGMMKQDVKLIQEGLQGVAAALSGLLGSVIGYYFGESAAGKRRELSHSLVPPPPAEQEPPGASQAGIEAPPKPPLPDQGGTIV
jgi:hypothetical protein